MRNAFSEPDAPSTWKPPTPAFPFFGSKRTPGAIASSVWKLRPFGSVSKDLAVMFVVVCEEVGSSEIADSETSTTSETAPTFRAALMLI